MTSPTVRCALTRIRRKNTRFDSDLETGRNGASELCRLALRPCYCALVSATGINSSVTRRGRALFSAGRQVVGRKRTDAAPAPSQPGSPSVDQRSDLPPFRTRPSDCPGPFGACACSTSAAGAGLVAEPLRRMGADVVGDRPVASQYQGSPSARGRRRPRYRLPRHHGRGTGPSREVSMSFSFWKSSNT